MGCVASKQQTRSAGIPFCGAPVNVTCRETTLVMDAKMSGMFTTNTSVVPRNEGALYQSICEAANENLEMLISFPKMEMPAIPMSPMMGLVGTQNIELRTTYKQYYTNVDYGKSLATIVINAPMVVDHKVGFLNVKTNIQDGVTAAITQYAAEGYKLCGTSLSSQTSATISSGSSSSIAQLIFQKPEPSQPEEITAIQSAIQLKITAMGFMKSVVPDYLGLLNQMGADGWSLAGFLADPSVQPDMTQGLINITMDMPMRMIMRRVIGTTETKKYLAHKFYYTMKIGMLALTPTITGDPDAVIQAHAAQGWLLKGSIQLPMEQSGFAMRMPQLLYFESGPTGGSSAPPPTFDEANSNAAWGLDAN